MDDNEVLRSKKKLEMLIAMQLPCYDNGKRFTVTSKLDKISELLKDTSYREIKGDLFRLFTKVPASELEPEKTICLSTHADFVKAIKKPFVQKQDDKTLLGTFDNSATNAAALYLLLEGSLPDNVVVAFTGNEEHGMKGALELDRFFYTHSAGQPFYFAMDVTDIGFGKKQFSIENTFSVPKGELDNIIKIAKEVDFQGYLYPKALPDEAYQYAALGAKSCSLCVPTTGPMHSNEGCFMELGAYLGYIDVVMNIAQRFSPSPSIAVEDPIPIR